LVIFPINIFYGFKNLSSLLTIKSVIIFIIYMNNKLITLIFCTFSQCFYRINSDFSLDRVFFYVVKILVCKKQCSILSHSESIVFNNNARKYNLFAFGIIKLGKYSLIFLASLKVLKLFLKFHSIFDIFTINIYYYNSDIYN